MDELDVDWDLLGATEWDSFLDNLQESEEPRITLTTEDSKKRDRFFAPTDDEMTNAAEEGTIKATRHNSSLGRILASAVVAIAPIQIQIDVDEKRIDDSRKEAIIKFMACIITGNMNGLAKLVQQICSETCILISPDLREHVAGRAEVMMLFGLMFENFPDGIFQIIPGMASVIEGNTVSTSYSFMGTRIFDQPIQQLFEEVRRHWAEEKQAQGAGGVEEAAFIDTLAYHWVPVPPNRLEPSGSGGGGSSGGGGGGGLASAAGETVLTRKTKHSLEAVVSCLKPPPATSSAAGGGGAPAPAPAPLKSRVTRMKRRMDFVFLRSEIVQIIITPI